MGKYIGDFYKLLITINETIKNMDTRSVALGVMPVLVKVAKC